MRLEEIERSNAEEQRVKRLKANASAAKERAKQLKTRADVSAERLKVKKARTKLGQLQQASVTKNIKPVGPS